MREITTNDTTAARDRASAIRSGIDAIADALERVPQLIIEAREAEDWRTLGYDSWDGYVRAEFGTSIIKLDKATRQTWAVTLSHAGMSSREIAPVVNVSYKTVQRDLGVLSAGTNVPAASGVVMPPGLTRVEQIIFCEAEADRLEAEAEALRREIGAPVVGDQEWQELVAKGRQAVAELKALGVLDEHGRQTFTIPATVEDAVVELNRLDKEREELRKEAEEITKRWGLNKGREKHD